MTNRILGQNGKVTEVEFVRLRSVDFCGLDGPTCDIIEGTEHTLPADTILVAIGQTPDLVGISDQTELMTTPVGTLRVDPETLSTNCTGVFAAGDVVHGPRNFVEAVADGQRAAFYMDRYLRNGKDKMDVFDINAADIKVSIPADIKKAPRRPIPVLAVVERKVNFNEVVSAYSPGEAMDEASRCLNCAGHLCKNVCPYASPRFPDSGRISIVKCSLCVDRTSQGDAPACVISCPVEAIDFGPMEELVAKYGDKREVEGFANYRATSPSIVFSDRR
jgi:heterodisulfide reductase subunit A